MAKRVKKKPMGGHQTGHCEVKVNEWSIFGPLFFLKLIYIIDHVYS